MKNNLKPIVLILLVLLSFESNSQNNCSEKTNEALKLLKTENPKSNYKKIIQLLSPCAKDNKDEIAQYILGKVYLESKNLSNRTKGFKLIKAASKQNLTEALTEMGLLYKYGLGCKQNNRKAVKWFKKAHNKGNQLATYALGYMYYKGFGDIKQDYRKAVDYFKQTTHPMAKYWLGISHYYGYGVPKDIAKATNLLGEQIPVATSEKEEVKVYDEVLNVTSNDSTVFSDENTLTGVWKGTILFYDWLGKNIEHHLPIELVFDNNDGIESLKLTWKLNKQEISNDFSQIDNTIFYNDFNLKLPYNALKEELPKELVHHIKSVDFSFKAYNNVQYLVGQINSTIPSWKEKSMPSTIVLEKKITFENSEDEISEEALQALSDETDKFIKFYPNPFVDDVIVSYAIENSATTEVILSNLDGSKVQIVKSASNQKPGTYHYFVNGSSIDPGVYLLSIKVNNELKTRTIIKTQN